MMRARFSAFKTRLSISSSWLLFLSAFYFATVLNLSLWQFIYTRLEFDSLSNVLLAAVFPVLLCTVLLLLLSFICWPYISKAVIATLLLVSSVANYMMFQYGVVINSEMIRNVFETNTREAMDLLSFSGIFWFFLTGLAPFSLLACSRIRYRAFTEEIRIRAMMIVTCLFIVGLILMVSFKDIASFGRNHHRMLRVLSPFNYLHSTRLYFKKQAKGKRQYEILDANAKLAPYADPYPTVFILIVGETARSRNFSLNGYEIKTNPRLEKEKVISFPDVASCGTSTTISVPCMFSSKSRSQFDVYDESQTQNFLDILQSAGYHILWRENDDGCKGVCNRVETEYYVPERHPGFCDGKSCFDEVMLDDLDDYLRGVTKDTFIVLHTIGSHGPTYYQRYPAEFRKFTPTCDTSDLKSCTQEEIVNTYNNSLLYTDHVVAETIGILKRFPYFESGLLYVSDHGESLGENNIYLHGLPYSVAPDEQKKVPMVLWMSDNMVKYDHLDYQCIVKNASKSVSHDNLFHTLIGLMEVNSSLYDASLDIFDACRKKPLPKCGQEGVKCGSQPASL